MKRNSLVVILFLSLLISCSVEKYKVTLDGKEFVLEKGMSMTEVKNVLGTDYEEQQNKAMGFQNWIYPTIENEQVKITYKDKKLVGAHNKSGKD